MISIVSFELPLRKMIRKSFNKNGLLFYYFPIIAFPALKIAAAVPA